MRPFIAFLIAAILTTFAGNLVFANEAVNINNGLLVDGRAMVPLRSIFNATGVKVKWNNNEKQVVAIKDSISINFRINEEEATVNGKIYDLDAPIMIIDGQTMIPIRLLEIAFGANINWEEKKNIATITMDDQIIQLQVKKYYEEISITISAAGDVTLGGDENSGYQGSFNQEAQKNGLDYFVKNIKELFKQDDLTMVNLETTLTTATVKAEKKFRFKADPSFTKILTQGNIESVNLANNHTFDYLQKGYADTVTNLKKANIGYFGFEHKYMKEMKGVKVGVLGYKGWSDSTAIRKQIKNDIQTLRKKGAKIIIVHFHWGEERSYTPNKVQKALGRYTINSGADLVLGHHPHVVQGIEEYNGKFIVYSLGNFMFGGNKNPSDKDTFVFQQTFYLKDGKLTDKKEINVIPFSISSVANRNNYQPTPMESTKANKLMQKLVQISKPISNSNWALYESTRAVAQK